MTLPAAAAPPPPALERFAPELDLGRACADDYDFGCAWREGEEAFRHHPDDPWVQNFLSSVARNAQLDMDVVQQEFLPVGLAFAESPSRAELLTLVWRTARYVDRIEHARAGPADREERDRLLDALARYRGLEDGDTLRAQMQWVAVLQTDSESPPELPEAVVEELAASPDPVVRYALMQVLPFADPRQYQILDELLAGDPDGPRYSNFLLFDAALSDDPVAALRHLWKTGLPDPRYDDNALTLYASLLHAGRRGDNPDLPEVRRQLWELITAPRQHDSTEKAVVIYARMLREDHQYPQALEALDYFADRGGIAQGDLDDDRAEIYEKAGEPKKAADAILAAISRGGTDYEAWYEAGRNLQAAGEPDEAMRLFQFYLVQLEDRAAGRSPYGPPAGNKELAKGYAKVWGHLVELQPRFFGREAMRQLLEMLALTAAGLLSAARLKRARAFAVPGLFAAELAFFGGLFTLRADPAGIPVTSWLWLLSTSARVFVLVGGGLYLSAAVGLPRRAGWPLLLLGCCLLGAGAGWWTGIATGPRYVLDEMPAVARLGELGLSPRSLWEVPALAVALLRGDAAALLVWPALALAALGVGAGRVTAASEASPVPRGSGRRRWSALAGGLGAAAVFGACASIYTFPLALGGAAALLAARSRLGAAAPFAIHACFLLGGLLRAGGIA